ncbi:MAG: methyltransferase domain-containing protein [Deltaproteobacteria bacterium]|jgi:tocopherol O-methyltransferase|nr:methyltransferase domain-containing protein [Deltaproteobacteria bacterium]MBW2530431.1 methyltransferase domain-containing protein [Deltaproteobacteria bacterium]
MTHAAPVARLHGDIASFYDRTSGLWEQQWGEHMHHGFYGPAGNERKNHQQAQVDLIEELLRFAGVQGARRVLDVGCGIGGSAIHLARRFGASARGITLSPVQASRAERRAAELGLDDVRFEVGDAMQLPYGHESFDLVWSLEVGEHIADRPRFLAECARVLEPGGRLVVVAWCHRPVPPALSTGDRRLLDLISRAYHLPPWSSLDAYRAAAESVGLEAVRTDDWSTAVSPFWPAVVRAAVRPRGLVGLARAGWPAIRGALTMGLMVLGSRRELIRYGVMTARKPVGEIETRPAA